MSQTKFDLSRLTDFELSILIIARNTCNYKAEQINELLNKIGEAKGYSEEKTAVKPKNESSELPGSDFSKLPWRSYATKQGAGPDEAAWIFSNTNGSEELLVTLKAKDGKATIGIWTYQLQGNEHQFIARNHIK